MNEKLEKEIQSFQNIWHDGFRTGHHPICNQIGIIKYAASTMKGNCCLEIGCGGGQWSKWIYQIGVFDKIYCIDVLSAEHNKFWEYVGEDKKDKIEYIQVKDFSLDCIPENSLDYVFSYDVFCHISAYGQELYLKNLYNKCKNDCLLFIMYADVEKFTHACPDTLEFRKQDTEKCYSMRTDVPTPSLDTPEDVFEACKNDKDGVPFPGRWYWIGTDNFCKLLEKYNYQIIYRDVNIDKRNPMTLFRCNK